MATPSAVAQDSGPSSFEGLVAQVQSMGDVTVTVGPKTMTFSWQGIQLGGNVSTWIREKVDGLDGNGPDGNVSAEEADNAKLLIKETVQRYFDEYANDHQYSGFLLIDTTEAQSATVDRLVANGLEGPVNSGQGIDLSFAGTVNFPTHSKDVHTVKLDMDRYYLKPVDDQAAQAIAREFSLTIRPSEGWSLDASSVQPECASAQYDEASGALVFQADDVNCFTGHSGVIVAFAIARTEGSAVPGFEVPLVLLGLLGLVLLRRR